ncbi:MAG TPA: DNA polymerase IV, partial [Actinomycetota bacterium]|nr:DNA polymerase IV [Actinomycetota bacterium]
PARAFGVRSGMPTSRARRLCPGGIFIQPDFDSYMSKSKQVREVFNSFSSIVEPVSLDEAFIDVSRARRMWANPPTIAEALRDRVMRETGLVVSVGVAPNRFLAKVASRRAKPDGIVVVREGDVEAFLHPLHVGELWGVGEQTVLILERLGLRTVGDVAALPRETLERALGSLGAHLADLAAGRDDRPIVPNVIRKSLGADETFEQDLVQELQMAQALLKLSDRVCTRLRSQGISGRTVTLKVRFGNFATLTRSRSLPHEIDSTSGIFGVARDLLRQVLGDREPGTKRIRLLGITMSNLSEWPASEQLTFDRAPNWSQADRAIDRVRFRFGDDAVGFGSLLEDPYNQF